MPAKTPEQLEKEADDLYESMTSEPEPEQGQDAPGGGEDTSQESEPEGEPEPEGEDGELGPGPEGESPDDKDTSDTDLTEGLSLENAAERIRNAQARMHQATTEAAEHRRQVGALKQENDQLKADVDKLKGEIEQLKQSAPVPEGQDTPPVEDLQDLVEEYPHLMGPLMKQIEYLQSSLQEVRNDVGAVKEGQVSREEVDKQVHFNAIYNAHPDANEVVASDDFRGWLGRQSEDDQRVYESGTAAQVIELLNRYKVATGRQKRVEEARREATPSTPRARQQPTNKRNQPKFTRQQIDAMSPEEFAGREAEIDKALAEGLVW